MQSRPTPESEPMTDKPFAFFIARKPFDYREPPLGRVIGSINLGFLKPVCADQPGKVLDVSVIVDVNLTEHLLSCPKALSRSKPHDGHGIDTGPSQQ